MKTELIEAPQGLFAMMKKIVESAPIPMPPRQVAAFLAQMDSVTIREAQD